MSTGARAFGLAIGTLFVCCFGSVWLAVSLAVMHRLGTAILTVIVLGTIPFVAASVYLMSKTAAEARSPQNRPAQRKVNRVMGIINAVQWTSIGVAVGVLSSFHEGAYILPVIILIVGAHFLPIGRTFQFPLYYATGIVLVLWAVAYSAAFAPDNPIGGLGTGIVLWTSAIANLWIALREAGIRRGAIQKRRDT